MAEKNNPERPVYSVKICHNCGTPLAVTADTCFSCHHKVGDVGKHGKAKKPVDWKAYVVCIFAWVSFFVYIWWAFFLPK